VAGVPNSDVKNHERAKEKCHKETECISAKTDQGFGSAGKTCKVVAVTTRPTDMLFPGINPDWLYQSFRKVCENLSIEDFSFHDLRHTAASWLRMKGADIHTVAQLLGHKDLRMAARYQHLSPAFLAEAVGRLDGVFGNLCYQDVTKPKGEIAESSLSALK
jgi:Phage integrase family